MTKKLHNDNSVQSKKKLHSVQTSNNKAQPTTKKVHDKESNNDKVQPTLKKLYDKEPHNNKAQPTMSKSLDNGARDESIDDINSYLQHPQLKSHDPLDCYVQPQPHKPPRHNRVVNLSLHRKTSLTDLTSTPPKPASSEHIEAVFDIKNQQWDEYIESKFEAYTSRNKFARLEDVENMLANLLKTNSNDGDILTTNIDNCTINGDNCTINSDNCTINSDNCTTNSNHYTTNGNHHPNSGEYPKNSNDHPWIPSNNDDGGWSENYDHKDFKINSMAGYAEKTQYGEVTISICQYSTHMSVRFEHGDGYQRYYDFHQTEKYLRRLSSSELSKHLANLNECMKHINNAFASSLKRIISMAQLEITKRRLAIEAS